MSISVYVIASIYRNTLTTYFAQQSAYPSWNYLCLNIPVIDWIALVVALNKKPETDFSAISEEEPNRLLYCASCAKRNFQIEKEDTRIRIAFFFLVLMSLLISYQSHPYFGVNYTSSLVPHIFFGLITLRLAFWYMSNQKAVYFIYLVHSLLIIGFVLVDGKQLIQALLSIGISNIIVHFALFHFEAFEFLNDRKNSERKPEVRE
ncbi:MAG: hypothetical protein ACI81T_001576 [Bacteroidia bacterium]|jgi:hypothetical protein